MSQSSTDSTRAEEIRAALQGVNDPELGASIVDLNMVRNVRVEGESAAIDLVLTVAECPLGDWIAEQARQAALTVPGISEATVTLLDEPWRPPGVSGGWRDWVDEELGRDS